MLFTKRNEFLDVCMLLVMIVVILSFSNGYMEPSETADRINIETEFREDEYSSLVEEISNILSYRYSNDFELEYTGDELEKLNKFSSKEFRATSKSDGTIAFDVEYFPITGETRDNGWFEMYQTDIQRYIKDNFGVDVIVRSNNSGVVYNSSICTSTDFAGTLREFKYEEETLEDGTVLLVATPMSLYRKMEYLEDGRDTLSEVMNRVKRNM